jgi:two-component system cell cycle sensor histidine kinase/response regulator CckA
MARRPPRGSPGGASAGGEAAADGDTIGSEARLQPVLEHLRAVMVELGPDGRILYASPSLTGVLGYAPEDGLGRTGWLHTHEDDRSQIAALSARIREDGQPVKGVLRARHKSGHWVWVEVIVATYRNSEGERRTVSFVRDVSEARATGEALRASEDRLQTIAERASDLIIEVDGSGRFLFVSDNCERILGRPAEEAVGRTLSELLLDGRVHPDDSARMSEGFAKTLASGRREGQLEFRVKHADGSWRWFESRFTAYRVGDSEWRALILSRDVTERYRAQVALEESEERYRAIADNTGQVISEADEEGRLSFVSHTIERMLGYRPEELVGTTPIHLYHPDDVERAAELFLEVLRSGVPQRSETIRARHRDGSWRWIESQFIRHRRGDAVRALIISRDVTVQRQAEEERLALKRRVQQAQRLEGLGVLAGGIAHDFNNLLTPILGDASLALMDLPEDSPLRARLQRIQRAARQAGALTHQMLAYAGKGPLQVAPLDLSSLVREIGQLLESSVGQRATLVIELADDLPPLEGDAGQLAQVVMNLLTNAAEAAGEAGGRVTLRTGLLTGAAEPPGQRWLGGDLPPGPCVYVEVEDEGSGMDPETQARIFDPFFTTKFTGRGLGLAAVLGIVRGHRGAIAIDSEPGRGTRFRVAFPAASGRGDAEAPERAHAGQAWRTHGTALVIESDEGARELARSALAGTGLAVVCSGDARRAIELLAARSRDIRLVLLDAALPRSEIEAVIDSIRSITPEARVLLASAGEDAAAADPVGVAGHVRKPFTPQLLVAAARRALAG